MKRIVSIIMLFATAVALGSCQKQEMNAPEMVKVEGLNFSAEKPEFDDAPKTEWTGSEIHWSKGDVIRVGYTCDGVWQNAAGNATAEEEDGKKTAKLYASKELNEASAVAKFSVPRDKYPDNDSYNGFSGTASGIYEFYAVYPSGAVSNADFKHAPSVSVKIPAEQTPLADSFDSSADLMVAKSVDTFEGLPEESISLNWTRLVAHGHLTLKNLQIEEGEVLMKITLTADEEADMVGHHSVNLSTHEVTKASANKTANSLTVKANNLTVAEGGNVTFWTSFLPCTWKSLTVVAETDKATYTRSIDLTGNEKTFAQNARNTLGINMTSAEKVLKDIMPLPFVTDFSEVTGNQSITSLEGFSVLEAVYQATGAIRLASGSASGLLSTSGLNLSKNFRVIVTACGWDSDEVAMTVSAGEQKKDIDLVTYGSNQKPGTWVDYVMNFEPVGSAASVQFSAAAGVRYFIRKIQILEGHVELVPALFVTAPSQMTPYNGGAGKFSYAIVNPVDGKEVTATTSDAWIKDLAVDQETKTVSYTINENTSEEAREATITLSYEGAESVEVVISQAGKPAPGEETDWVSTSFADLKAGDQVVIVSTKETSIYAMSNNNGIGNAPAAVAVSYANGRLSSEPENKIIWYVGVDGSNRIFYASSGKDTWLYCIASDSKVKVGTNAHKTFAYEAGYLKHLGTSKYLGVYKNQDWRCYDNTTNYIKEQTFQFFVKSSSESGGGQPEP